MNLFDLLPPISPASPCGPDPENDAEVSRLWGAFLLALNDQAQVWQKYRQDKLKPGTRIPDWAPLQDVILEVANTTKHLSLAVALTECLAQTEGLQGLRDGLLLITAWSATWWEQIHPAAANPAEWDLRADIIGNLNSVRTRSIFRCLPLVEVREKKGTRDVMVAGPFSLDDYKEAQALTTDPVRAGTIKHAFAAFGAAEREQRVATVMAAREAVLTLAAFYEEKKHGVKLGDLVDLLNDMATALRGDQTEKVDEANPSDPPEGGVGPAVGAINSRDAAFATLDGVIAYFKRAEPSSPVPYLLQRAQRCVGKTYLEIVDELGGDRAEVDRVLKPQKPAG